MSLRQRRFAYLESVESVGKEITLVNRRLTQSDVGKSRGPGRHTAVSRVIT
jgi:hypothetical protein